MRSDFVFQEARWLQLSVLGAILILLIMRLFSWNFIFGAEANISAQAEIRHVVRPLEVSVVLVWNRAEILTISPLNLRNIFHSGLTLALFWKTRIQANWSKLNLVISCFIYFSSSWKGLYRFISIPLSAIHYCYKKVNKKNKRLLKFQGQMTDF